MERPRFLTFWLIFGTLGGVNTLIQFGRNPSYLMKIYPNMTSGTLILYMILGVILIMAYVILWKWKKLGFYLYVVTTVAATLLNIKVMGPVLGTVGSILGVAGLVILYLAMRPVWKNFK